MYCPFITTVSCDSLWEVKKGADISFTIQKNALLNLSTYTSSVRSIGSDELNDDETNVTVSLHNESGNVIDSKSYVLQDDDDDKIHITFENLEIVGLMVYAKLVITEDNTIKEVRSEAKKMVKGVSYLYISDYKVALPVITVSGNDEDVIQEVTITCNTEDSRIMYTVHGEDPRDDTYFNTREYEKNTTIYVSLGQLKVMAVKHGHEASEIVSTPVEKKMSMIHVVGTDNVSVMEEAVSDFYLGAYEVTEGQWEAVMTPENNNFYDAWRIVGLLEKSNGGIDAQPANVNWVHAIMFCNALSVLEDYDPVYYLADGQDISADTDANLINMDVSKNGYRLPTEIEWEYAAGGGNIPNRTHYAGTGETVELTDYAWYSDNANAWLFNNKSKIPSVGTAGSGSPYNLPGSGNSTDLGFYDMSGNVAEWCWDVAPTNANNRIVKGGHVTTAPSSYVIITGNANFDVSTINYTGFRVARNAD